MFDIDLGEIAESTKSTPINQYENLWEAWLESHAQSAPEGFVPIRSREGYQPTFLQPEKAIALINALTPRDLYTNPQYVPFPMDYPAPGFDIKRRGSTQLGIPQALVFSTEPSIKYGLKSMEQMRPEYSDIPSELHRFIPQGIYEHELGHYLDPRLLPETYNQGYITRFGLPGNIASRELPALRAESKFWDYKIEERKAIQELKKVGYPITEKNIKAAMEQLRR